MTTATWVLLAGFLAIAAVDWLAVARRSKPLEYAAKPACMVVLIAAAVALDPADDTARALLVAALALSMLGDVLLMLPGREPGSDGPDLFAAGLGAFLCAHLAYVAAFWVEGPETGWIAAGAVAAVAIGLAIGRPVVAAVRASDERGLTAPVAAYSVVISAMVLSAFATGEALAIAGALVFAASDATIARERFMRKAPWGPLLIIVTYHVAQALLVVSFT